VTKDTSDTGEIFFIVKYTSTLNVIDLEDSAISYTQDRYMEINRFEEEGLKIVSVYTQVMDPLEELRLWWSGMDPSWQRIFLGYLEVDTVAEEDLLALSEIDSLDLSQQFQIEDVSPLIQLRNLRYLSLKQTGVRDITSLRYAAKLKSLDLSYTLVDDLTVVSYLRFLEKLDVEGCSLLQSDFLSFASSLKQLNISHSGLFDFEGIGEMKQLERLDASNTALSDLVTLEGALNIRELKLSNTAVSIWPGDLSFKDLKQLDLSGTGLTNVEFIASLPALQTLDVSETKVNDISSVEGHPSLTRINADFTEVSDEAARTVMSRKNGLVVLTETDQLIAWWNDLSEDWRAVFLSTAADVQSMPTLEDLVFMRQIDTLDISGTEISDPDPLLSLKQLKHLNISGTEINSISFLQSLQQIEYLDCSNTGISELVGIQYAKGLQYINFSQTSVNSPGLLAVLPSLKMVVAEETDISEALWQDFLLKNSSYQVIYQSKKLLKWWDNLESSLKDNLKPMLGEYSIENLHDLVRKKSLNLQAIELSSFHELEVFSFINKLEVKRAKGDYLPDLTSFSHLDSLLWQECPLATISAVKSLPDLRYLSVANTAIEDLDGLDAHPGLQSLDCSSTQVRSIKPLRDIKQLNYLNISNTRVWQLNWLYDIRGMKTLECFNSKVSSKKIEQFKEVFPDCEIIYY
jgi:Leucine-rich repeat (LRR) protein